jgi:hypothetical protein
MERGHRNDFESRRVLAARLAEKLSFVVIVWFRPLALRSLHLAFGEREAEHFAAMRLAPRVGLGGCQQGDRKIVKGVGEG